MSALSLSDCQPLTPYAMIWVPQFGRNSQLCHLVTNSLNRSQVLCLCLCLCCCLFLSCSVSSSFWSIVRKVTCVYDSSALLSEDAEIKSDLLNDWQGHPLKNMSTKHKNLTGVPNEPKFMRAFSSFLRNLVFVCLCSSFWIAWKQTNLARGIPHIPGVNFKLFPTHTHPTPPQRRQRSYPLLFCPLQYSATSPGFEYRGDSMWWEHFYISQDNHPPCSLHFRVSFCHQLHTIFRYIEASAQWYMAQKTPHERDTYVEVEK